MKPTSGISLDNAAVAATPKHLLQFAVFVDRDLRDVGSCALAHGWRAFEAGRVKGGGQ